MQLLRWLLFPVTILYTLIIWLRNKLYDLGIFKTKEFPVKTIVVGNLAIGGAGKSPLTQYLIHYFSDKYKMATLSRGYGRKTKGFRLVGADDHVAMVGDEPLQFKKNYPDITVAVDENRAEGIEKLQRNHDLIILDDAYQHRKITAKCNILLFDFHSILKPIILLPTGNFRDTFNQTKRADVILISKCPEHVSQEQKLRIENKVRRHSYAPIYYSKLQYLEPIGLSNPLDKPISLQDMDILLITGIANPKPLLEELSNSPKERVHMAFKDHHDFKDQDYKEIIRQYKGLDSTNKIILTTEKDTQRLDLLKLPFLPIYYLPITFQIDKEGEFLQLLEKTVNEP
ncbi:tetraacyldisaccharide 4'-kinase [Sphingobacterium sp. 1.A.4]|uniref:tetraacyldisaccharide 4'-kinase n=1 Tax=Sphingobacterium sp. 1.A.4 TaxID=2044603 RepID=UPI000C0BDF37|nr:tetraacyldisaccharide 4'-kinase [Sphingobacterium sp. 1.A.4]